MTALPDPSPPVADAGHTTGPQVWHRYVAGNSVEARRRALATILQELRSELLTCQDPKTLRFLQQDRLALIVGPFEVAS